MLKKAALTTLILVCSHSGSGAQTLANPSNAWAAMGNYFQSEWNKSLGTDVYFPVDTWHNRNFYSAEQIEKFNEIPIGLGFGKSYRDEEHNRRGFYAMAFADSHRQTEPIVGYFFAKNMLGSAQTLSLGLGYTLFVTARADSSYLPIPGVAPLISADYGRLSLNATYLPGTTGAGHIGFFWLVYSFKN